MRWPLNILAAILFTVSLQAQPSVGLPPIPPEVQRLVPEGHTAIAIESGDLNRDGRKDYLVVVEQMAPENVEDDFDDGARTALVITRQPDDTLKIAGTGPKAVFCRRCGGIWGDPLSAVHVEEGRFTIEHYGGSNWRWGRNFTFAWSRRHQTWQLVRVEHVDFHISNPDKTDEKVYTPPKHFGRIDLADFDPDDFLGKGPR